MKPEITIKDTAAQEKMRHAGKLLAQVFKMLDAEIRPGITTMEINDLVEAYIVNDLQSRPASKGQYGYKYVLNSSVNEVVCHGVPKANQPLKSSDIVNIDITLENDGYIADSSKMYVLPEAMPLARKLVKITTEAMWQGIGKVRPGAHLGDVGSAIQTYVEAHGYSVVREYCGHGIGQEMHEPPEVTHYGLPNTGVQLREGMTFTIEPMINQGSAKIKTKKDGWTVITRDKKLSAQTEHTILVTSDGCEVLTLREEEETAGFPRHLNAKVTS